MITPLIKQIDKNSLITFPSSLEDFNTYGRSVDKKKVYHSHFALLNLPDISTPTGIENKIDFDRIESVFVNGKNVGANGIGDRMDLSESLQNFALNYEALLTEQEWYDKSKLSNCSERIFFKWLKEIGAIRYKQADESYASGVRFSEEAESADYNRLVQYISKIGVGGKITGKKNAFTEVYVNIPSNVGRTPNVLFKINNDENYYNRMIVTKPTHSEFINGYDSSSEAPSNGLPLTAMYSKDMGDITYESKDSDGDVVTNWNDYYLGLDAYLTDGVFGDASNDTITMSNGVKEKTFIRSRLDGVELDFDVESYRSPDQLGIDTLEDINSSLSSQSFEFNAILLYYTVYDEATKEKAVNLYGVAFIGDVQSQSVGTSSVERKQKIKSDAILGNVGNGYGYRFNFKMDARQQDVNPLIEIDEFETKTFSMAEFSSTMLRMGEILARYEKSQEVNDFLIEQNRIFMDYIRQMDLANITSVLGDMRRLIQDNNLSDINGQQLSDLSKKINDILSGGTDVNVNIITKFTGEGGLNFSYSEETDTLRVINDVADYGETESRELSVLAGNVNLVSIKSLKKISLFSTQDTLNNTVSVLIDDSIPWKKGMSVNLTFSKNITGTAPLKVYTDKAMKVSEIEYGVQIFEDGVSGGDSYTIICLDSDNFKFVVQKTKLV